MKTFIKPNPVEWFVNWLWDEPPESLQEEEQGLAAYIADYINEELERNPLASIDRHMVANAIDAFEGGAGDMSNEEGETE
jgi:hypothetical protein